MVEMIVCRVSRFLLVIWSWLFWVCDWMFLRFRFLTNLLIMWVWLFEMLAFRFAILWDLFLLVCSILF